MSLQDSEGIGEQTSAPPLDDSGGWAAGMPASADPVQIRRCKRSRRSMSRCFLNAPGRWRQKRLRKGAQMTGIE